MNYKSLPNTTPSHPSALHHLIRPIGLLRLLNVKCGWPIKNQTLSGYCFHYHHQLAQYFLHNPVCDQCSPLGSDSETTMQGRTSHGGRTWCWLPIPRSPYTSADDDATQLHNGSALKNDNRLTHTDWLRWAQRPLVPAGSLFGAWERTSKSVRTELRDDSGGFALQ